MSDILRERAEHAAKYDAHLVVPAREIKQLLDESDDYDQILTRTGEILTGVANALNGPPPPRTTWSHHDLAEKAAALAAVVHAVQGLVDDADANGAPTISASEAQWALDGATALAEGGDQR